jgi:predicted RNase H-like HicB family nuclease
VEAIMTNLADLNIYTGKIAGRYIVATGRSPYFYFEADSEEAALDLAKRALAFYEGALSKHDSNEPELLASRTFTSRIKAKDLAA